MLEGRDLVKFRQKTIKTKEKAESLSVSKVVKKKKCQTIKANEQRGCVNQNGSQTIQNSQETETT